jgi:septal ring factor EnvC (AmiA/AmiB activator)
METPSEAPPLTYEQIADALAAERTNVDRLTTRVTKAEGERDDAKADLRVVNRERDNVAARHRQDVDRLEGQLRIAREAAAEMRGRLREARSNQMVRRGDLATNPYGPTDDEEPF